MGITSAASFLCTSQRALLFSLTEEKRDLPSTIVEDTE